MTNLPTNSALPPVCMCPPGCGATCLVLSRGKWQWTGVAYPQPAPPGTGRNPSPTFCGKESRRWPRRRQKTRRTRCRHSHTSRVQCCERCHQCHTEHCRCIHLPFWPGFFLKTLLLSVQLGYNSLSLCKKQNFFNCASSTDIETFLQSEMLWDVSMKFYHRLKIRSKYGYLSSKRN